MNIDANSEYKIMKIGIKDDAAFRFVDLNDQFTGTVTKVDIGDNKFKLKVSNKLDYLRTSEVVKITETGDNFLIETLNSVYSLEKVK